MEAEEDVAPPGMETDSEVKKGKTYTYDYIVYVRNADTIMHKMINHYNSLCLFVYLFV